MKFHRQMIWLIPFAILCCGCETESLTQTGETHSPKGVEEFFAEYLYRKEGDCFSRLLRRSGKPGAGYVEVLSKDEAIRAVDDVFRPRLMKPDPEMPNFRRDPEEFVRMKRYLEEDIAGVFRYWDGDYLFYSFVRYFPEGTYGDANPWLQYYYRMTSVLVNPGWDYSYTGVDGECWLSNWFNGIYGVKEFENEE